MDNRNFQNLNRRNFFQLVGAGFLSAFVRPGKPTNNISSSVPPTAPVIPRESFKVVDRGVSVTIDFHMTTIEVKGPGTQAYHIGMGMAGVEVEFDLMR